MANFENWKQAIHVLYEAQMRESDNRKKEHRRAIDRAKKEKEKNNDRPKVVPEE